MLSQVEDCERAYFKMDNVLIDDRRIHVDFSQSVAKLTYSKPGKCRSLRKTIHVQIATFLDNFWRIFYFLQVQNQSMN